MIEWQLPRYGRGPYDEVPPVLERVLRSPSLDEEAWRELWHLLATEGLTVSAASFAALPYLRDLARSGETVAVDRALELAGAIVAGVVQDHGADELIREMAPVIAELRDVLARRIGDGGLPPTLAVAFFRADLAFAGATGWSMAEYDFDDGFYSVSCPHCDLPVTVAIGDHGRYSAYRDWCEGDVRRRPLKPCSVERLGSLGRRMHGTARALGLLRIAEGLTYLFGQAECPDCASAFVVADRYAADNEPHHSTSGPVPIGGW
ncbi:hypothetical protein [Streptomyces sp. NK15101]|uniref:hypothetical protein n=1 Tax=Streptomyces sp. NK15101 TaxID=2873261 RepID=UPI001CECCA6F|nr:hypothetical protein [Streptomyces sp. NK15101]